MIPKRLQERIEKEAREFTKGWPTEVMAPPDMALFYERGAAFGFQLAMEMTKPLVERIEVLIKEGYGNKNDKEALAKFMESQSS